MVCGWDKTGPQLYYVDNDGTRLRAKQSNPYFCVGRFGVGFTEVAIVISVFAVAEPTHMACWMPDGDGI